jgi:spermidine synthase
LINSSSEAAVSSPADSAGARRQALAAAPVATLAEVVAIGLLLTASGAAALLYEVLWLKQLAVLFGSTAQATAATLSIFFLGLSLGARAWGRRAARSSRPLGGFAALELAIAVSAAGYFALFDLHGAIYQPLAAMLRDVPGAFPAAKLLLAATILLPPAFFMGGTLPFMSQQAVRRREDLGATVSWIYAANTVGGALGAFAAAFVLPAMLGFRRSYAVAMMLNLTVAGLGWLLSRRSAAAPRIAEAAGEEAASARPASLFSTLAFLSGAATLGLEVLWTRMFAQVLHNSVYSFAAILITFLIALALGAAVANRLCRLRAAPAAVLPWLLIAAGVGAGASPLAFHLLTGGLRYVAPTAGWWGYVAALFTTAAAVLVVPGIFLGTVFPYVLRMAGAAGRESAGETVGRLASWNTVGSIVGSLLCGFVLIEWLGLWASIRTVAVAYLALAVLMLPAGAPALRAALAVALAVVVVFLDPTRLPIVSVTHDGEVVRETWESGHAIVAVTQAGKHRLLKLDNYYSLGGTTAVAYEEAQADIPLIVHPSPRRVFFLGLGTGITAGAALHHEVEQVTVCELIPDVITAARRHFAPFTNGLFDDPRVRILAEDGRQHLRATDERYDVIVSDLFIPWQSGTGSLYTLEHFAQARARLREGGLFAQWLPLYQFSERDALIVMRTMLEVFPQVTMWRGDFAPERPIVALIGQEAGAELDPDAVTAHFRVRRKTPDFPRTLATAFTGMFYAGNLGANRDLFAAAAVNTDDTPLIEYQAPIAQREQVDGERPWFASFPLARFEAELLRRLPPVRDPYLARLAPGERDFALAGMDLFSAVLQRQAGNTGEADYHAESFRRSVPAEVYAVFQKDVAGERTAKQRKKAP